MELKGITVPQFREVPIPRLTKVIVKPSKPDPVLCVVRASSLSLRETFPVSYHRWKSFEVHCNDSSQSIHQSSVSKNDSLRIPELAFDRLQLSDQEYCGVERRAFSRFIARGAMLDEEYWTAAWLRAEAHWESLSYMRHCDSYKRKYAEQGIQASCLPSLKKSLFSYEPHCTACHLNLRTAHSSGLLLSLKGRFVLQLRGPFLS